MPDTNVLVTRFLGTDWVGEVVDFMVPRRPGGPLVYPGPLLVRRLRAVRGTVVSGSPAARRSTSGGRTTPCMRLTTVARCSPAPARGPNWSCAPASGSLWPACRDGNGYPGPRRGTGPPAGVRRPAGAVGRGGGRPAAGLYGGLLAQLAVPLPVPREHPEHGCER
jgi:hypothetical protein